MKMDTERRYFTWKKEMDSLFAALDRVNPLDIASGQVGGTQPTRTEDHLKRVGCGGWHQTGRHFTLSPAIEEECLKIEDLHQNV